ncbi:hypothetical protein RJ641_007618, partial [Dillenia turbinata]
MELYAFTEMMEILGEGGIIFSHKSMSDQQFFKDLYWKRLGIYVGIGGTTMLMDIDNWCQSGLQCRIRVTLLVFVVMG